MIYLLYVTCLSLSVKLSLLSIDLSSIFLFHLSQHSSIYLPIGLSIYPAINLAKVLRPATKSVPDLANMLRLSGNLYLTLRKCCACHRGLLALGFFCAERRERPWPVSFGIRVFQGTFLWHASPSTSLRWLWKLCCRAGCLSSAMPAARASLSLGLRGVRSVPSPPLKPALRQCRRAKACQSQICNHACLRTLLAKSIAQPCTTFIGAGAHRSA